MSEKSHEHLQITLLYCVFDPLTKLFTIKQYAYCNDCAMKMAEPITSVSDTIPKIKDSKITKVICNIRTNGYEYRWFGHDEDRSFMIEHGDKWE